MTGVFADILGEALVFCICAAVVVALLAVDRWRDTRAPPAATDSRSPASGAACAECGGWCPETCSTCATAYAETLNSLARVCAIVVQELRAQPNLWRGEGRWTLGLIKRHWPNMSGMESRVVQEALWHHLSAWSRFMSRGKHGAWQASPPPFSQWLHDWENWHKRTAWDVIRLLERAAYALLSVKQMQRMRAMEESHIWHAAWRLWVIACVVGAFATGQLVYDVLGWAARE
jgi:hypothetical protein